MTTLGRVAALTRKSIFIGGGVLGGLLAIALLVMVGGFIKDKLFPTPPAPPTVSYGKLPPISFPKNIPVGTSVSFYVDTISGFLPTLPDRAKVYQLNQSPPNLLSYQKAQDLAASLSFPSTPTQKTDTTFTFTRSDPFQSTLTIDLTAFNFTMDSSYLTTVQTASLAAIPVGQAPVVAQTFFMTANALGDIIDQTQTRTLNQMYDNTGTLVPADRPDNAQVATVDFVHQNINQLPVVYAHPPHTNMTATVVSVNGVPMVIRAKKFAYDLMPDTDATYPLKTAQQAFDQLQKGQAYIAEYDGKATSIPIKNVSLAYYFPDDTYQYVLPVVVLSNDSFVAYVPAISDTWISSDSASLNNQQ